MTHIYHGTIKNNLGIIKPFKRFTPGGADIAEQIPPRIYATYNPAFAVAHSFPWSSEDGVDIVITDGVITIIVPKEKAVILAQSICIYTLLDDSFSHTTEEETGFTYHSEAEVIPVACQCFTNVTEAMDFFGGKVQLI